MESDKQCLVGGIGIRVVTEPSLASDLDDDMSYSSFYHTSQFGCHARFARFNRDTLALSMNKIILYRKLACHLRLVARAS